MGNKADGPDNTSSAIPTEATPEEHFGLTSPNVASGDPEPTPQSTEESPPADPGADQSTDTEEPKEDAGKPDKLYAGKYKSLEDLEKAAIEKERFIEQLKTENKTFRTELDKFKAEFNEVVGKQKNETAQADRLKANIEVLRGTPEFAANLNKIAPSLTDEEADGLLNMFGALMTLQQTGQPQPPVDDEAKQLLAEIKMERVNEQFYSKFPNAKELEPDMVQLYSAFVENQNDPLFSLELFYKATLGNKIDEITTAKAKAMVAKMSKTEKDKLIAGSVVAGQESRGGPSDDTRTPVEREIADAWGL